MIHDTRARAIREAVEEFEDSWEADSPPEIGAFAEQSGTRFDPPLDPLESRRLLVELVRRDLEYRWKRRHSSGGETPPSLDEYANRLSELGPRDSWPDELIASDFKNRMRWGDRPGIEDTAALFPGRREAIRALLRRAIMELATEDERGATGWPKVPEYEIVSELGSGAFGVVYKAKQAGLDDFVAIKMLHRSWRRDAKAIARFEDEARAISRLEHDNIVRVRSVGQFDGLPYLVLEYLGGGTLASRLSNGPLDPGEVAVIAESLADAMTTAHDAGIIHRDLKPENILLDGRGRAKISDFGLARLANSQQTATTAVLGTPNFMAPEQASGRSKYVTPSADIFALGAILYNMLSGHPPFVGHTREQVLAAVRDDPPKPLTSLRPSPPRDLVTICEKCLEKSPADRIESAAALREQLQLYLDDKPLTIRPVNLVERAYRWTKRKPSQAAIVLLTPLALGLGVLAYIATRARVVAEGDRDQLAIAKKAADEARDALAVQQGKTLEALRSEEAAVSREIELRKQLARIGYIQQVGLAHKEWRDNNIERSLALLRACPEDLRNWEWGYVEGLCRSGRRALRGHSATILKVDISPNGDRAASCDTGGTVIVWDLKSGHETVRPELGKEKISSVQFVDEGTSILGVDDQSRTAVRWDAMTGKVQRRTQAKPLAAPPAYSRRRYEPGGRYFLIATQAGPLEIWDSTGDRKVSSLDGLTASLMATAFNADGRKVLGAGFDGRAIIWWTGNGEQVVRLKNTFRGIIIAALTERYAVLGFDEGTVSVWDVETGAEVMTAKPHAGRITGIAFTGQGGLITSGIDGAIKLTDIRLGRESKSFKGHVGAVYSIAVSSDGKRLMSGGADQVVAVWDIAGQQDALTYKAHRAWQVRAAMSRDNRLMATSSIDRTVKVWDLDTESLRHEFSHPEEGFNGVRFGRDDASVFAACVDGTVLQIDTASGKLIQTYGAMPLAVTALAIRPDGRRIAGGGADGVLQVWEVGSAKTVDALKTNCGVIRSVAFSPDGLRIATCGSQIQSWLTAGWRSTGAYKMPPVDEVTGLVFSPDGDSLFSSSSDGVIRVWDVATGIQRHALTGHRGRVTGLAISPDGQRLASSGEDGSVKLWDAVIGQEVLTLDGHATAVESVEFSPDGTVLVSGSSDGIVKLWKSK